MDGNIIKNIISFALTVLAFYIVYLIITNGIMVAMIIPMLLFCIVLTCTFAGIYFGIRYLIVEKLHAKINNMLHIKYIK